MEIEHFTLHSDFENIIIVIIFMIDIKYIDFNTNFHTI